MPLGLLIPPKKKPTAMRASQASRNGYRRWGSGEPRANTPSDDAIRSLIISHKLLGTNEWFVIHHTNCGMQTFTDEVMRSLLRQSLDTAKLEAEGWHDVGRGPGSSEGEFIDWLTIKDQAERVTSDVRRIKSHRLVPSSVEIYGYVYDVKAGRLIEVPEATKAGQIR
jgi:carbonic anhydrase